MFVLDQFEEVFHPTNKGVADAAVLVERLLDHFFQPHPRCYVVITMRSEHLNDCAAYLELPDAINKSSFLLRRLDVDELREAIVGPAQRYLRLMARSAAGAPLPGAALPEQVVFEPDVLERVLRDVTAITHDPDHLPLLQHLLARLWLAALEREEMDQPVPTRIAMADLVRAVNADAPGPAGERLALEANTLRECVHNWPERIYGWLDEGPRAQLALLLRHLAFKDPNTGAYSQQRIDVDDAARLLGETAGTPMSRQQLRALLGEGFLGSVDYLHWDDEDPARITLKVSHESFIRGWRRFKGLADADAERYEVFLGVARRCAAWAEAGRHDDDLLGAGEVRRLRRSGVANPVRASGLARLALVVPEDWLRRLRLDRDAERLSRRVALLPAYVAASERQLRRRNAWQVLLPVMVALAVVIGLVVASAFTVLVQSPAMRRAELVQDAFGRAEVALVETHYARHADALEQLRSLLGAAATVDGARTGAGTRLGRTSELLIDAFGFIDPVRRQGEFLQGVLAQSEPVVNEKLRTLLITLPWVGQPLPGGEPLAPPRVLESVWCHPSFGEPDDLRQGRLWVSVGTRGGGEGYRRSLFMPAGQGAQDDLIAHAALWHAGTRTCRYGDVALALRAGARNQAVIDASLRFVAMTDEAAGRSGPANDVLLLRALQIQAGPQASPQVIKGPELALLADPALVGAVRRAAGNERLRVVRTWSTDAGRVLDVGGEGWRLFSPQARRLAADIAGAQFMRLHDAAPDSTCRALAHALGAPAGRRAPRMLDAPEHCLAIYRWRSDAQALDAEDAAASDELGLWVYAKPSAALVARMKERPPLPVAVVSPYARVDAALPEDAPWAVGRAGEFTGWLALRTQRGQRESVIGMPLTTCALWRLGHGLLPPGAPGAGDGCESP
jgi:hypothetical protein